MNGILGSIKGIFVLGVIVWIPGRGLARMVLRGGRELIANHEHRCMIEDCEVDFTCDCPDSTSTVEDAILSEWELFCPEHRD